MGRIAVLAIDDEPSVRALVQRSLSPDRYAVTVAADGDEGASLIRQNHFDVAIVDLRMPGHDGLEIVRWVKCRRPACITIMMTGYGDMEVAQELIREGCDDLLLKPLPTPSVLDHAIQRCLEKRRLRGAIESLSQLDDAYNALLNLAGRSVQALSDRCLELINRLKEADASISSPDGEALCIELQDGLRSLKRLIEQDGCPAAVGCSGPDVTR